MAEDTEKRFQRIMDKLYRFPKPRAPLSSGAGGASGQQKWRRRELAGREEAESSVRHVGTAVGTREAGTPTCRPWDRGDLMKRLATFKAMTWFGKPKAIDPVNCARRGWTNVDMDTLACEACGARLLFTTPSSWTLPQVEKAAAVFSLKLDSGHKLLCPWIDNACDETLAFFPPTPPLALIEGYRERSASLLQISALPAVSSSAISYMRNHQLDDFLAKSSSLIYKLDGGMKLTVNSGSVILDNPLAEDTADQYYQAYKIISLCGWELRMLPYVVDRDDESGHLMEKGKAVDSSLRILSNQYPGFLVYSTTVSSGNGEEREDQLTLDQCDPSSAVLDCKLCGACVGLWAFKTISRPLELFNLTEAPEDDVHSGPATGSHDFVTNGRPLSLNLTIAGGPLPSKQSFKPRISLPIVTRHLRSTLGSNGDVRAHMSTDAQGNLKCRRIEDEYSTPGGRSCDVLLLNANNNVGDDTPNDEPMTEDIPSTSQCDKGVMHEERSNNISTEIDKCLQNATYDLVQGAVITENADNKRSKGAGVGEGINLQPGDGTCLISDIFSNSQGNTSSQDIASDFDHEIQIISAMDQNANHSRQNDQIQVEHGKNTNIDSQEVISVNRNSSNSLGAEVALCTSSAYGKNSSSPLWDNTGKFDPIRQHRPFCPWIAPMCDESILPGWRLTLRALVQDRCSPQSEAPPVYSSEADDPILSVRKLFSSPPAKRLKRAD